MVKQFKKSIGLTVLAEKYGVTNSTTCAIRNRNDNILKKISTTFGEP